MSAGHHHHHGHDHGVPSHDRAFAIGIEALAELGFEVRDVVRTRMYVTDIADADAVGRVHGQVFAGVDPAATMVEVSALIDPLLLVEVELEAVQSEESSDGGGSP